MPLSFPALDHSPGLVYLDSAATSLTCKESIDALSEALSMPLGNPGRSLHSPAARAESMLHNARGIVASFGGVDADEVLFFGGATEALNSLSHALGDRLGNDDEIIIGEWEHHSNILPWLELCRRKGSKVLYAPINKETLTPDLTELESILSPRTKIVCLSAISNVLGTELQIESVSKLVRSLSPDAVLVIDACQAVAHGEIPKITKYADFTVASSHKAYAPSGVGILWSHREQLQSLPPLRPGGGSVEAVTDKPIWKPSPSVHEGGTHSVALIHSLAASFSQQSHWREGHARSLAKKLLSGLTHIPNLMPLVTSDHNPVLVSLTSDTVHPHDISQFLSEKNICVRAGFHCASMLHARLQARTGSLRISFGCYTTDADIDTLLNGLREALYHYGR